MVRADKSGMKWTFHPASMNLGVMATGAAPWRAHGHPAAAGEAALECSTGGSTGLWHPCGLANAYPACSNCQEAEASPAADAE